MALWGRNDQAVTANSTTTRVTSNGAPIGTYALVKAGGGPNAHFGNTSGTRASADVNLFGNTTSGAFVNGIATGVFGVDTTEIGVSNAAGIAHAGWNFRVAGTGPIVSIAANTTLAGYDNTDIIVVNSPQAGGNASISFTTNSTGGSLTFTIGTAGYGFTSKTIPSSNIFVTNSTGGTATGNATATGFVITAGGRAGRVSYETLVAMGSLGAQTAAFGTAALVADASDDTILPDS